MLGNSDEHRAYEDFAVRHVMGSLDEAESGTFRSHLLDCSDCRARVGELRSIASDLAEVERAERRVRAAKLVETKEREAESVDDDDVVDDPGGPGRGSRVLVVAGVVLIVVLSIWNFVLRGQNDGLRDFATALHESAEVVNFGDPWTTEQIAPGHEALARVEDNHLAVMVRGTDDGSTYQLKRYDAEGVLLDTATVDSVDGQVRWFGGPLRAGTHRIDVTLDRQNGDTIIFRASPQPAE